MCLNFWKLYFGIKKKDVLLWEARAETCSPIFTALAPFLCGLLSAASFYFFPNRRVFRVYSYDTCPVPVIKVQLTVHTSTHVHIHAFTGVHRWFYHIFSKRKADSRNLFIPESILTLSVPEMWTYDLQSTFTWKWTTMALPIWFPVLHKSISCALSYLFPKTFLHGNQKVGYHQLCFSFSETRTIKGKQWNRRHTL